MHSVKELPPVPAAEELVQQEAYAVAHAPEHLRQGQRNVVSGMLSEEFAEDLMERKRLLSLFDESIRLARGEVVQSHSESYPFTIPAGKIDWVDNGQALTAEIETVHTPGIAYGFLDLTARNAATRRAIDKLADQTTASGESVLPKLQNTLKAQLLPKLYDDILHGRQLRPRTRHGGKSGRELAATDYPAYKLGVQGTNNRAIVLLLEGGEKPVLALAALYDHGDDQSVLRAIA